MGSVLVSRVWSQIIACSRVDPHISMEGRSEVHTCGRSAFPKSLQRSASSRCEQGTPAGFASEEIDGAMQQAAQCGRQSMRRLSSERDANLLEN